MVMGMVMVLVMVMEGYARGVDELDRAVMQVTMLLASTRCEARGWA
jgi:hypothetical protein